MKMIDKRTIQIPQLDPVKFIQRNNGTVRGYAVNTYHGLVKKFNEDRVSIIMNITKPHHKGRWPRCSYFAVFDGHGGNACSDFLKENMHKYITENEHFPYDPIEALKEGFRKAQQQFVKFAEMKDPIERSGSCAIVILIIDETCYIANVGDSRAILSTQLGRKVFALSKDHKPEQPLEKQRIAAGGGKIYQSVIKLKNGSSLPGPFRIHPGRLSVSRAFGDIEAKLQKFEGNPKVLIAKPQITYFEINSNEHDFLFMGSDGIFDKLTNNQIAQVVWEINTQRGNKDNSYNYVGEASSKIIEKAMSSYSLDNLTSLLIMFEDNGRSKLPRKNLIKPRNEECEAEGIQLPIKKSYSSIRLNNHSGQEGFKHEKQRVNQNKMANFNSSNVNQDKASKQEKFENVVAKRRSLGDSRPQLLQAIQSPNKIIGRNLTRKNSNNVKKESIWKMLNQQQQKGGSKPKQIEKIRY